MENPRIIKFDLDCLRILRSTLLAVAPEEGCALLLGDQKQSSFLTTESSLQVRLIWPCCNVWGPNICNIAQYLGQIKDHNQSIFSKETHFALDPREQIMAQRWARKNNLKVLGTAHSHPTGSAIPSSLDKSLSFSSCAMVIIGKNGTIRAWWAAANHNLQELRLAYLKSK